MDQTTDDTVTHSKAASLNELKVYYQRKFGNSKHICELINSSVMNLLPKQNISVKVIFAIIDRT